MNENFQEILADSGEVLLDSLINNEILKEIPVLGTSLKLIRGIQSISDKFYLRKIKFFIEYLGEIDEVKKIKLIEEAKKSKSSRAKFGDALFTTIEQSDSELKIEYVAVAFEAFLNNDINEWDLREICHIIKIAFTDDLTKIIEDKMIEIELKKLVGIGLAIAKYKPLKISTTEMEPDYELSHSAKLLREAWSRYNKYYES